VTTDPAEPPATGGPVEQEERSPAHVSTSRAPRPAPRWRDPAFLALAVPALVYVLLSLAGTTTSNIGVDALRVDPAHPLGTEIGTPQNIRADEYRTDSPIALGWITTGGRGIDNPLNVAPNIFHQLPSGPVSTVTFFDGTIARLGPWLPDAMLFAAKWWLPTLLLFLGMPSLFRSFTGRRRWGYLAAVLIFFAPTNAWWSGWPVNTLGFISASMALLLWSYALFSAGRRGPAVAAGLVSGVLMARYPTYYQPFAIVLGLPLLAATALHLLLSEGRTRTKLVALAVAGGTGALLAAGTMLESIDSVRVGLHTVYPGQRVSTGQHLPFWRLFGATDLSTLPGTQQQLTGTNASEVSSAFAVLFVVAVVLRCSGRWKGSRPAHAASWVLFAFTTFWMAWCTIDFGSLGKHLPLVDLVPSMRDAQVVGLLGTLTFCLVASQWDPARATARRAAVASAVLVGGVSLYAGRELRTTVMPLLTDRTVLISSLVAAGVVFAVVRWPDRLPTVGALMLAAAAVTATVNPIEVGLADLRGSSTARYMTSEGVQARADRTVWATDTAELDSLLFATGVPSLTSRQQLGPNRSEWLKFDPGGLHEDLWNRGGTFPHFYWTGDSGIVWEGRGADNVVLHLSPCTAATIEPRLTHVVSSQPLDLPCTTEERKIRWGGKREFVYDVRSGNAVTPAEQR
jgi:hypothetical protein